MIVQYGLGALVCEPQIYYSTLWAWVSFAK